MEADKVARKERLERLGADLLSGGADASEIDTGTPHPARMYDYYLGGHDNYEVDRMAAEEVITIVPTIREMARANRAFLGRAVRFVARQGVRQFLDIGTGIPGPGNTNDVARQVSPDARVVYVDNDPIVLAHARALLAGHDPEHTTVIKADLREPEEILEHSLVRGVLDFDEPVAVLLVAVLHFIQDSDDPIGIVRRLMAAVPDGSYLVISHGTGDFDPEGAAAAVRSYDRTFAPIVARSKEQILRFFEGLDVVEPGIVQVPWWRPDGEVSEQASAIWWYGVAGRKG
ncbi:MAG TPA: SAM-dependent methyltransferase [Actinocrinis sp.]|uniref:SAM-dependent methyltransferase n=1 Tax=Actinocrinis sp. TaxID=1920516 RepID=UPI002DDD332C|nr:SAM-dependent methyltransferase [Actinocrinis sp.]HEV2343423.1 SAM-dependent methyltransferase [Actinocrinis sp.]